MSLSAQTVRKDDAVLNLDCTNVYEFDRQLYQMLTTHPTETIPIFDTEVNRIAEELMLEGHLEIPLQVSHPTFAQSTPLISNACP